MPSPEFLQALADLRDTSNWTGKLLVDIAQGRPKAVSVPIQADIVRLPERREQDRRAMLRNGLAS